MDVKYKMIEQMLYQVSCGVFRFITKKFDDKYSLLVENKQSGEVRKILDPVSLENLYYFLSGVNTRGNRALVDSTFHINDVYDPEWAHGENLLKEEYNLSVSQLKYLFKILSREMHCQIEEESQEQKDLHTALKWLIEGREKEGEKHDV